MFCHSVPCVLRVRFGILRVTNDASVFPVRRALGAVDRRRIQGDPVVEEATQPLVERGVYWARARKKGRPVCYCVDSHGNERRRYVVMHDSRCQAAIDALWDHLDVVDPIAQRPQLRLVKETPTLDLPDTARRARPLVFDPYNVGPLPYNFRQI